jgi:hypothetical protein
MWLGFGRDILERRRHLPREEDGGTPAGRDIVRWACCSASSQAVTASDNRSTKEIGIETDVLAFVTNRLGVDTTDREDACTANHPYVDGRLCFSDAASR